MRYVLNLPPSAIVRTAVNGHSVTAEFEVTGEDVEMLLVSRTDGINLLALDLFPDRVAAGSWPDGDEWDEALSVSTTNPYPEQEA